jgi:3-deoxy-D-manno-octulosonic-acid transferase
VAIPLLLLLSFKKKYHFSIPSRLFLYKNRPFKEDSIWFHVCSFGEVRSLKPILNRLNGKKSISVTTNTGYEEAQKYDADVRFLPFEIFLPFWIRRSKVLVVSEAELWFMLFFIAKQKGTKTVLINARISDNSYKSYMKFSWFYRYIFANIDEVFAQSQKDYDRLKGLGAKNIKITGNIKAYQEIEVTKKFIKPNREVVTIASSHDKEEALILDSLSIKKDNRVVIVVPRHPERFDSVDKFLKTFTTTHDLSYHKFSQREDFDSDIVLVDALGELINIYAISDSVILGGSFVDKIGGHNPLEPAYFGSKIISGQYIFNQQALFELVENIVISDIEKLNKSLDESKPTKILGSVDLDPIIKSIGNI